MLRFGAFTEERYAYLINGEAQAEIQQYMSVDHSAEEYAEVKLLSLWKKYNKSNNSFCSCVPFSPTINHMAALQWLRG